MLTVTFFRLCSRAPRTTICGVEDALGLALLRPLPGALAAHVAAHRRLEESGQETTRIGVVGFTDWCRAQVEERPQIGRPTAAAGGDRAHDGAPSSHRRSAASVPCSCNTLSIRTMRSSRRSLNFAKRRPRTVWRWAMATEPLADSFAAIAAPAETLGEFRYRKPKLRRNTRLCPSTSKTGRDATPFVLSPPALRGREIERGGF